jgi:hypothetical protein
MCRVIAWYSSGSWKLVAKPSIVLLGPECYRHGTRWLPKMAVLSHFNDFYMIYTACVASSIKFYSINHSTVLLHPCTLESNSVFLFNNKNYAPCAVRRRYYLSNINPMSFECYLHWVAHTHANSYGESSRLPCTPWNCIRDGAMECLWAHFFSSPTGEKQYGTT